MYSADHRAGAMHGKQFLLDSLYAGIDEKFVYGRLDFKGKIPDAPFELVVNLEMEVPGNPTTKQALRVQAVIEQGRIARWEAGSSENGGKGAWSSHAGGGEGARLELRKNFEFRVPLEWMRGGTGPRKIALTGTATGHARLRLRVSLWQNRLPLDALPLEGWLDLPLLSEEELHALS